MFFFFFILHLLDLLVYLMDKSSLCKDNDCDVASEGVSNLEAVIL